MINIEPKEVVCPKCKRETLAHRMEDSSPDEFQGRPCFRTEVSYVTQCCKREIDV